MASKVLTVVPLLVLSGLFFVAGIVDGGILFLAFTGVMVWAYLLRGVGGQGSNEEETEESALER